MHGEYKVPGGKLVVVDLDVQDGRLTQVQVSGDFFLEPDTTLDAINAALTGLPADAGMEAYTHAAAKAMANADAYGLTAEAVAVAVTRALEEGAHA